MRNVLVPLTVGVMLAGCCAAPQTSDDLHRPEGQRERTESVLGGANLRHGDSADASLLLLVRPEHAGAEPTAGVIVGDGATLTPADTQIHATVYGPVAEVRVKQTFKNETAKNLDATYLLPVPLDAAVMDFTCRIGERHFRAMIVDAALAEKIYAAALKQGKSATVVKPEAAGWRLRLGQIRTGVGVETEVGYAHLWPGANQIKQVLPADSSAWALEVRDGCDADVVPLRLNSKQADSDAEDEIFAADNGFLFDRGQIGFKRRSQITVDGVDYYMEVWPDGTLRWDLWSEELSKHNRALRPTPGTPLPVAANPCVLALWASQEIQRLTALDLKSGKPDHAGEILALARKHHVATAATPLLMVDAK